MMPWIVRSRFLSLVRCTGSSDVVVVDGFFFKVRGGRTDPEREEEAARVASRSVSLRDQTPLNQRRKEVMMMSLKKDEIGNKVGALVVACK